uniref:ABC transmembrane type-2 domain-containing protein n=1 Tax=Bostrychia simpliciuscula TaxID=324754 RepID=A0A1Z1M852_9FLOR|nr:hypothetical protein [Bostrychia simpliciuscula]ARW62150.1 hypothetical protein [Bostrychia simpliciuscula]
MKKSNTLSIKNKFLIHLKPKTKINLFVNKKIVYKNFYEEIKILTNRLYIQTKRRPSNAITSIIQPLLWLLLFGALFQNAPINLFEGHKIRYGEFLSPGILIFTAFTSSINAGLPIIFDREFGFFNRLLISPLIYKNTLIISSIIYIWGITIIQIFIIIIFSGYWFKNPKEINEILAIISISTFIVTNIATISICYAFILPGHIEFIALTLIINLPTLFSSTALAPLSFMPYWLQIIACLNPLTYGIEIVRHIYLSNNLFINKNIINTIWFSLHVNQSTYLLILINILSFILVNKIIKYKYD